MMKAITRFKFFIWSFGHFKVPLIGHLRPKLITLTDTTIVIRLPFNRRSKNHLQSMYFGALAVGADLAGGLHAFYHAEQANVRLSLAFKSFQAQFLKRPMSDVYFVCEEGDTVKDMIQDAKTSGLRINKPIAVTAYTHYPLAPEAVATFQLELSLKMLSA